MKCIIPAKATSTRVPDKNWRPFYKGLSLVDITILKLLRSGICSRDVYVSCESEDRLSFVEKEWHVNSICRDDSLCDNSVSLVNWIRTISGQIQGDDDIAWCQVCDPLFDEYKECWDLWRSRDPLYDSLVVKHKFSGYLLSESNQPVGWSFGKHHTPSQNLPEFGLMPFTLSILTRDCIRNVGYHVGLKPLWHTAKSYCIDIDNMMQFVSAQACYNYSRSTGEVK